VEIIPLNCPKNKFLEAIIHTFKGVFQAKKLEPDVLHIHAVGPALMVPLARMLGLKVVFTHHGPDYERKKWGFIAKLFLRMGEFFGVTFANEDIAISQVIADEIKTKYGRKATVIPNGVVLPEAVDGDQTLKKYELNKGKYILAVGRFVPEKGFGDLIEAFNIVVSSELGVGSKDVNLKLVIAGDADHEDGYSRQLKEKAKETPNVVLTGFITGKPLQELYSHAGLFVLPSYYEGLPIVLLEAMSYGLSCIVSDIPANREVELSNDRYFKPGDISAIAQKLEMFINRPLSLDELSKQIKLVSERYDWDHIAEKTLEVYRLA
jgi:glycosyltransferase involved in cell wall biosynthesis